MNKQEFSSLSLTSDYFNLMLNAILYQFKEKHQLTHLPKSSQLYGYGNYDESKPSLKEDFEEISTDFINGKYLYDKTREFHKGKPIIKLNKYYKELILAYLNIEDIASFINENSISEDEKEKQLLLVYDRNTDKTDYYVNYYFGEDNVILKGKTVITNNWKKIRHTFVYPQEDGSIKEHYDFGNITRREDTVHIHTKTLLDGKLVEGATEIYYIGHNEPSYAKFLIGSYCAFDVYTNTVAGETILEKCSSKEQMEEKCLSEIIPPYIALEIRNKRIVNKSVVPKTFLEISANSPYASIYGKIPGTYEITFLLSEGIEEVFQFQILKNNFRITTLTKDVYIENDAISLLNKGSILHLKLDFAGIILLHSIDIYFKTYYLKGNKKEYKCVFSGIDNENRLVNGKGKLKFKPIINEDYFEE